MTLKKMKYISNFVFGIFLVCFCCLKFGFGSVYAQTGKMVKIAIVGNGAAGKTAFRDKLCEEAVDFESRLPTLVSSNMREVSIQYDGNTMLYCNLWDTSGTEDFKAQIIEEHIADSKFIVIVMDTSENRADFSLLDFMQCNVAGWMQTIRGLHPHAEVIWVFTKVDLLTPDRRREFEGYVNDWTRVYRNGVTSLFVSARTGENMDQFFEIIKRVIREKNLLESLPRYEHKIRDTKDYDVNYGKEKKGDCSIL